MLICSAPLGIQKNRTITTPLQHGQGSMSPATSQRRASKPGMHANTSHWVRPGKAVPKQCLHLRGPSSKGVIHLSGGSFTPGVKALWLCGCVCANVLVACLPCVRPCLLAWRHPNNIVKRCIRCLIMYRLIMSS